jgi:hypothetical protein
MEYKPRYGTLGPKQRGHTNQKLGDCSALEKGEDFLAGVTCTNEAIVETL